MKKCPNCGRDLLGLRADHVEICNIAEGRLPPPKITDLDQIRSQPKPHEKKRPKPEAVGMN